MCLMDLYVKLLNHNIAHVTYDAEIAGLSRVNLMFKPLSNPRTV